MLVDYCLKLTQTDFTLLQFIRQVKDLPSGVISISDKTGTTQGVHPVLVPERVQ